MGIPDQSVLQCKCYVLKRLIMPNADSEYIKAAVKEEGNAVICGFIPFPSNVSRQLLLLLERLCS